MMNILVINAGSSSLKFQLLKNGVCLAKGIVDSLGEKNCIFKASIGAKKIEEHIAIKTYEQAIHKVSEFLKKQQIDAIGHRVVHGGEKYHSATIIDQKVIKAIDELSDLAPLHNPPNLKAILACKKLFPQLPQVAVFDTSFHQTIPEKAYLYALPYQLYEKLKIRRYGFHGPSHAYVSRETAKLLKKNSAKIITCHLGNGSSITAVHNGKSVDTSMGFTPLEGLPMGTRSGDIDPAIIFYLKKKLKLSPEKIEKILLKDSGLKGISEISWDMRKIWASAQKNNKRAQLTLSILAYRIAKYIGAYATAMNGVDAITFTGGIGENAWYVRKEVCQYLEFLGLQIDSQKNKLNATLISTPKSHIKVFVIPTNEEEEIAAETRQILKNMVK